MPYAKKVLLVVALVPLTAGLILAGNSFAAGQEAKPDEGDTRLKVGDRAPAISVEKFLQGPEEADFDWSAWKGKVVVLEFWATWCAPCMPAIDHMNELAEKFAGKEVVFIAINVGEEEARVARFLKQKPMRGWVALDIDMSMDTAYNNRSLFGIPHTIVVGPNGKIAAVTRPHHVTEAALRSVLAGETVDLPQVQDRSNGNAEPYRRGNADWDQEEIDWKDGIEPEFQVIIQPVTAASGGTRRLRLGDNRWAVDGIPLSYMLQQVNGADYYHTDNRLPGFDRSFESAQKYRVSVVVPKGREEMLPSVVTTAVEAMYGVRARWELQEKEVLVLQVPEGAEPILKPSTAKEEATFFQRHGSTGGIKQPLERLTSALMTILRLPVVDETGLTGEYDWNLTYYAIKEHPVLINEVREELGLELVKARRSIKMLVIEKVGDSEAGGAQ